MVPSATKVSLTQPGRSILKMLPLVLLLAFGTGFDLEQARPAPEGASPPEQAQQEGEPAAQALPSPFRWRREKVASPSLLASAQPEPTAAPAGSEPQEKVLSWESGQGKSYLIPALELPALLALINIYDRIAKSDEREEGKKTYSSTFSSTWEHIRRQDWKFDKDPFNVNQFGHPYQGATMYGLARSTGLNFWESTAYSNAGSFLWEMAGETTHPSINDIATTGTSGSLLGEALFRMSALVLNEGGERPDFWHEFGAAILSPTTALNRLAFGERFKPIFPSHAPATFWRIRLGAALSGNADEAAMADFAISYGLPGKPGYGYTRPLDYFDFQISGLSRSGNPIGIVLLRGLLWGKEYDSGEDYRGIWGLYGSYDYISPEVFRVSTTALSLGTTGQYWIAPDLALQGTLMGGVGFGAAGVTPVAEGDRDYHYGVTPQCILSTRFLFGTRASLDLVWRGYLVSGTGSDNSEGSERISRAVANGTVRFFGRHGIGLQFVQSHRNAHYGDLPSRRQNDSTVSLVYTFLGNSDLGAVEWRSR